MFIGNQSFSQNKKCQPNEKFQPNCEFYVKLLLFIGKNKKLCFEKLKDLNYFSCILAVQKST